MSIAASCPSCDREFKAKNELAGRKVKCPGCGAPVLVVAEEGVPDRAPAKAKKPVKPPPPDDEDDQEDEQVERPRKKKKKKAKSSAPWIIAAAAGGVALIVVVVLVIVFTRGGGANGTANPGKGGLPPSKKGPEGSRAEGAGRAMDAKETSFNLKRIGLAFQGWYTLQTRGLVNHGELSKFYENDPQLNDLISSKRVTIVWGLPKEQFMGNSSRLIGYETAPDRNGIRIVLRALGDTDEMTDAELQAALKQ